MADFGDDFGDLLFSTIRNALSRSLSHFLDDKMRNKARNWYAEESQTVGKTPDEAKTEADALVSREQACIPFGEAVDAAYMAQVCRENGIYAAALIDKDGNGFLQFAKEDAANVQACMPKFSETMTAVRNRELAERIEKAKPVTAEQLAKLEQIENLPDLPTKLPNRDVTLFPVTVRFNDTNEIENYTFAEQNTEGLDIDDDVFFSGYTHDKLKAMVGKDIGEDFTVMSVGQPYHVQARELAREAPGKEAPEHAPHVHDDRANDPYNHTKEIADKVKAAREQCRDYDDFKGILAKEGVGVCDEGERCLKNGEPRFYEARYDDKGNILPFGEDENGLTDWNVGADRLKQAWGVDATRDWFSANTPKEPQKDLQLICNAVRADLEQQGIQTSDRPDGQMGFLVHRDHEQAVIEAVENRFPGHAPGDLGIQFYDGPHHGHGADERIPADPQVADGSKDMDGRTPDIDQGVESHDGRDTMTATARMEYEQTASGDVAPSEVREQADASGHDDSGGRSLKDKAQEARDSSKQLAKESGSKDRDIDISDKFEPNGR